jgi:anti-sigma regulatory factor (Ser/Thr protein kinase)
MTSSRLPARSAATRLRVALPADISAPALARHAVREVLAGLDLDDRQADDIMLVASELVTNAVEHGERPARLELDHDDGRLTMRVFDAGETAPELRVPSPREARSRGLQLVERLATRWGYRRCEGGKYVWAVFLLNA